MSNISRRINTALKHLNEEDYENALIQISIAIDSTAKKKWPKETGVGKRIRTFIRKHETLLYYLGSAGGICMFYIGEGVIIKYDGKELSDLIYEKVRCALQHGDEITDNTIITTSHSIGLSEGKLILNVDLIYGLMFSVIIDPINCDELCESDPVISNTGHLLRINELWGNEEKLKECLKSSFPDIFY